MVVVTKVFALLTLWLRLRWLSRRDEAQQQYLLRAAEAVAAGDRLELDDQRACGQRFRVKIIRTLPHKEVRAK
jgi:membrane protein implicated in regulation of membrane protease activity